VTPTDDSDGVPAAHWFVEFRSMVRRLEAALGAGEQLTVAHTASERVARSLSFGLNSRALAVGALLDVPEAAAGAFDCIRSMGEACAQLAWLLDGPGERAQRALCLELGYAKADADNRAKVLSTHQGALVPEGVRANLQSQCAAAQQVLDGAQKAHGVGCDLCGNQGRTYRQVRRWLAQRTESPNASAADLNIYAAWVAASADAHQLSPNRWWNPEHAAYELELTKPVLMTIANTAVRCFLEGWRIVVALLRPEASAEIDRIEAELQSMPGRTT
jgi:hypothetical protein